MNSTRLHEEIQDVSKSKYKIKIGKLVPKNGVNLAYFHNKRITSNDNILVSEPPKNSIDHMTINDSHTLVDIKTLPQDSIPKDSLFQPSYPYDDENGYSGVLKKIRVDWTKNVHIENKEKTTDKVFSVTNFNQVPMTIHEPTIYPADGLIPEGTYDGIQNKISETHTVTGTKQVPRIETIYLNNGDSMVSLGLKTPSHTWPTLWNNGQIKEVNGYRGQLHATASAPYYATRTHDGGTTNVYAYSVSRSEADLKAHTWTAVVQGQTVTYRYSGELTTYSHTFHSYGVSRYWSSSNSANGGYGTADSTYHNANWNGKGIWSKPPKIMKNRYNHFMDVQIESKTYPGRWPRDSQGIQWWHDYTRAHKIVGKAKSPDGIMWASDYWAATKGKVWPPFDDEQLSDTYMTPYWYSDTNKICVSPGIKYSKNFAFNGYQRYFKDTISFYVGQRTDYKAKFVATITNPDTITYDGSKGYNGNLSKPNTVYDTVNCLWDAACSYRGVLSFRWVDWDGIGAYRGIVTKRSGISNTNPEGSTEIIMYPKSDSILYDTLGITTLGGTTTENSLIESELFDITNVFKDDTPLYYKCRLKYPIYNSKINLEDGVYLNLNVKLLDFKLRDLDVKKYKHLIKLVQVPPYEDESDPSLDIEYKDIYYVDVYTSFLVTNNDKIYCSYNAYDISEDNTSKLKPGTVEKLNVQPFFKTTTDYSLEVADALLRTNRIKLTNNYIMKDNRRKIYFRYRIKSTDGAFVSPYIHAQAMNTKYVLECEKDKVIGRNYIVSPFENERYLTAYDIVLENYPVISNEDLIKLKSKTFEVELGTDGTTMLNKTYITLFTKQDGSGVVSVETSIDTGVYDPETNEYTRTISIPGKYQVEDEIIYPAYAVKCKDVRQIKLTPPREKEIFENWHPGIVFGHFNTTLAQYGDQTKYTYSLPEFDNQSYSSVYGRPYIDIEEEKLVIINDHTVKVKNNPMYVDMDKNQVPINLKVARLTNEGAAVPYKVNYWSFSEGIIELEELINDNDNMVCWYTYEEDIYTYRGYYDANGKFVSLDLNPNQYHTYTDTRTTPYVKNKVYKLFNTSIHFFLKPSSIKDLSGFDSTITNLNTLYHKFNDDVPNNEADVPLGEIFVRNNTSLDSTQLYDSRTRGGGILEEIKDDLRHKLEPESDFYCDIGYFDGEPYSENAIVIIRLNKKILKSYGGIFTTIDVEDAVSKWSAFGIMPIIEYVDVFDDISVPQTTMSITSTYTNQINYTPIFTLSTIS